MKVDRETDGRTDRKKWVPNGRNGREEDNLRSVSREIILYGRNEKQEDES